MPNVAFHVNTTYNRLHVYYSGVRSCVRACMRVCVHNGWPIDFDDTRLIGKLAVPIGRHLLWHSCIIFTQHPQSQLVVYTAIIAEADSNYSF